jgi:hypothetical protein
MSAVAMGEYLNNIRSYLHLGNSDEGEIMRELSSHIDDEVDELKKDGLSEEEALSTCLRLMGSAKTVARKLYEAHSQGTWKQTLLAASPHLLFATLFALSWWTGIVGSVLLVVTLVFGLVIFFWWHEKPNWAFTWLGYSLLPVLFAGLALFYLPAGWSWIAIIVYIPLAAVIIYRVTVQTIRRDWLYSTLMLLPFPIVTAWYIAGGGKFSFDYLEVVGPFIGLSFLLLAVSVAFFIRLRQRWLKIILLMSSAVFILTLVSFYAQGELGLPAFAILVIVVLGLFIGPALLEHKIRHP